MFPFEWRSRELARKSNTVTASTLHTTTDGYTALRGTTLAFSALGKYLDSFGTGGGIRAGWGDSVNRSVFHAFAPAVAVSVLALHEAMHVVRKISGFFTSGRSPEIKRAGLSGS